KAAGQWSASETHAHTRAAALLGAWGKKLPALADARLAPKPDADAEPDSDLAFDTLRECFNQQVRHREELVAEASDALEFAFDFMERAFPADGTGGGQEMVVFVNELTLGPDSAPFLAENECERFTAYSRQLLLSDDAQGPAAQLDAELAREDIRQGEGSLDF
ncbi:MAG: hypothetical protein PHO10_05580, partial [Gemmiger sp.]|nr:hypothetical protein [Gemmiger sp.]